VRQYFSKEDIEGGFQDKEQDSAAQAIGDVNTWQQGNIEIYNSKTI
jgi:hypothetical protein